MPTKYTRFDFHVHNFLNSEDVKQMTAEEVGQYFLLLCDAWILEKEATLPDNPKYLARVARVDKVSPLVMSKFYKVEMDGGTRLRNKGMYEEWQATIKRSESARERGKIGNEVLRRTRQSDATATQQRSNSDASGNAERTPVSYHIKSGQIKSDQSASKEEIAATIAKSNAEIEQDNQQHKDMIAERDRIAALSKGQIC